MGEPFGSLSHKGFLQSVAAMLSGNSWALMVAVEYDSGKFLMAFAGSLQVTRLSKNQAQHNLTHDKWSNTEFRDTVSAARVLVTTLWTFLQPHDKALTGHVTFWLMLLWVLMMRLPVWDSGLRLEANDASLKARKRRSSVLIPCITMDTSWCFLASYTAWLASIRVPTVAWFMDDWRKLSRLERSGRVCTAAYCKLPMTARSFCLSSSVTFVSAWDLLSLEMLIGSMFLTYFDWLMVMFPLGSCDKSIPVKVNWVDFFEPNGYFFSNSSIFFWNLRLPPQIPSSTWTPRIPSGWWCSFLKMKNTWVHRTYLKTQLDQFIFQGCVPKEWGVYESVGSFG